MIAIKIAPAAFDHNSLQFKDRDMWCDDGLIVDGCHVLDLALVHSVFFWQFQSTG